MGWTITEPTSATLASQTPTLYQGNWDAIEDYMLTEHYTFTSSLSGFHLLGIAGVTMEGATSAITAIAASPGSGALAFDTTVGAWKFCSTGSSAGWKTIHNNLGTTRVRASVASNSTITSGTTSIVPFDTEAVDSLGEFSASTYILSAADAGYFIVSATMEISSTAGGSLSIVVSGSYSSYKSTPFTMLVAQQSLSVSTIAYVASAGTVGVFITAPSTRNVIVVGGAGKSFLRIHRVS